MATAREYFEKNTFLEFGNEVTVKFDQEELIVICKVAYDFDGGSKFIRLFVPETTIADQIILYLAQRLDEIVWTPAKGVQVQMSFGGSSEKVDIEELAFSGRILVYTPTVLPLERWEGLKKALAEVKINLLVRDGSYVTARNALEKPRAFISHDSRDKDVLVRGLANKLTTMLCPVWYDEYSLVPGQSLRESIETGLKECPKCVVVLSKNFFSNPGWTKKEFDSVYTREILQGKRVMIPVWLDVTKEQVYEYSPALLDTVGIPATLGVDEVARRLFNAITNPA